MPHYKRRGQTLYESSDEAPGRAGAAPARPSSPLQPEAEACPQPPRALLLLLPARPTRAAGGERRGQLRLWARPPPPAAPPEETRLRSPRQQGRPLPGETAAAAVAPPPRPAGPRAPARPSFPGTRRRKFIYRLAGYVLTSRSAPPPCVSVRRT